MEKENENEKQKEIELAKKKVRFGWICVFIQLLSYLIVLPGEKPSMNLFEFLGYNVLLIIGIPKIVKNYKKSKQ